MPALPGGVSLESELFRVGWLALAAGALGYGEA